MKNATKYADRLRSCFKSWMKEHKPAPIELSDPLEAFVRGCFAMNTTDARAESAIKAIRIEFVDFNELRVATDLEVHALILPHYGGPAADLEHRVSMVIRGLNGIFDKEHTLSLARLRTIPRRDARQLFRDLPEIVPFTEAYAMVYGFEAAAVPVDDQILALLKAENCVDPGVGAEEAQRFVEHQLKAEECYEFYAAARHHAQNAKPSKKKKS